PVTNGGVTQTDVPLPGNGVIYVAAGNTAGAKCATVYPSDVTYNEDDSGCGNVYISGTYSSNLTVAADNDVILAPTTGGTIDWSSTDEGVTKAANSDAVLGLIANRFVRVGHAVTRNATSRNCVGNVSSAFDTL